MLNRRNFLMASVAAGVLTVSGVAVAAPAPSKLVGHSLRCMIDLYMGDVAVADVETLHVTKLTLASFESAIRTYDSGKYEYNADATRSVEVIRQLRDEGKLLVKPNGIPTLVWTRGGATFHPERQHGNTFYAMPTFPPHFSPILKEKVGFGAVIG